MRIVDGIALPQNGYSAQVTARLTYTFALTYEAFGDAASKQAAERGFSLLTGPFHKESGHFASGLHQAEPSGEAGIYDLAFILLAFSAIAGILTMQAGLQLAEEIGIRLDTELQDSQGGYADPGSVTYEGGRRLFPQMHLFEACMALAAISPNPSPWRMRGRRLLQLITQVSSQQIMGEIDELYTLKWMCFNRGRIQGIGHHFEWSRLLFQWAVQENDNEILPLAQALFAAGLSLSGVHKPRGDDAKCNIISLSLPIGNEILKDERYQPDICPLWPMTELMRAISARNRAMPHRSMPGISELKIAEVLFQKSVNPKTGLWNNETDRHWKSLSTDIPTRVLYHLLPAFIEASHSTAG